MLPLTTEMHPVSRRRSATSVRYLVAPTPTGSRTTGIPFSCARLAASIMDSTVRSLRVPMFMTTQDARRTISDTSFISSVMTGDPPAQRQMLAQSLTVT